MLLLSKAISVDKPFFRKTINRLLYVKSSGQGPYKSSVNCGTFVDKSGYGFYT